MSYYQWHSVALDLAAIHWLPHVMCLYISGWLLVQAERLNQFDKVIMSFIRLFFPIWFAYLMIMVAFRIGVKKKRDR